MHPQPRTVTVPDGAKPVIGNGAGGDNIVTSVLIGPALYDARRRLGHTQRQMRAFGFPCYDAWERSARPVPFRKIAELADHLGTRSHDLLHPDPEAELLAIRHGAFSGGAFCTVEALEDRVVSRRAAQAVTAPKPIPRRPPVPVDAPAPAPSRPVAPVEPPEPHPGRNPVLARRGIWRIACRAASCRADHFLRMGERAPRTCRSCGAPLAAAVSVSLTTVA